MNLRLFRIFLFAVALGIVIRLGVGWYDCRVRGGHYLRGLFWMECIKP